MAWSIMRVVYVTVVCGHSYPWMTTLHESVTLRDIDSDSHSIALA